MTAYSLALLLAAGWAMLKLNQAIFSPGCPMCGARKRHSKNCPNREADEW